MFNTNKVSREEVKMALADQLAEVLSSLADIKKNMQDFRQEVKQDLALLKSEIRKEIQDEVRSLRQEMDIQQQRVSGEMAEHKVEIAEVQRRVAEAEEWRVDTDEVVRGLEQKVKWLQETLLDTQSRQMRNNIRVFNCPESVTDGQNMIEFMEQLFWAELDLPADTQLQIMRAHRALTRKPQDDSAPPRSVVINFHQFDTKEMVLRKAWAKEIMVAGKRLGFDHDYPPGVVKIRKEYAPLKRILKQEKISFQSPYTKLRVHWDDGMKVYGTPTEAARDIRARGYEERTPRRARGLESTAAAASAESAAATTRESATASENAMDEKDKRRKEEIERWQRVLRKKTGERIGVGKKTTKNKRQEQTKK